MNIANESIKREIASQLHACFDRQREAYLAAPTPDFAQRKQDLLSLKRLINENRDAIIDAICEDYGNRSRHETLFAEIITVTDGVNDVLALKDADMGIAMGSGSSATRATNSV